MHTSLDSFFRYSLTKQDLLISNISIDQGFCVLDLHRSKTFLLAEQILLTFYFPRMISEILLLDKLALETR